MKARRRLPDKRIIDIYEKSGLPLREIGKLAGRTGEWVRQLVNRAGVPKRKGPPRPSRRREIAKAELQRMYVREHLPMREIADRLGVGYETVRQELRRHGIERRSHHPSVKHPELRDLKVGESVKIPYGNRRPGSKAYLVRIYSMAKWAGIRVSVRSLDEKTVLVTRIGSKARTNPKAKISKEEMVELYRREDLPMKEIERIAGVTGGRIRQVAKEAGVPAVRRDHKYRPPLKRFGKKLLKDLYLWQGLSIIKIAEKLKTADRTVKRELERHGLLHSRRHEFHPNVQCPEIRRLKVGESVQLPRTWAVNGTETSRSRYYGMARFARIRVSVRTLDEKSVLVTRKGQR